MTKRKALLTALIITVFTGCKINQYCDAYSTDVQQCDEMYPYYNCDHPQMYSYTTRNYRRYINQNSYTPGYNSYYPNTQTIYYYPVELNNSHVITSPRPNVLGGNPPQVGDNPARKPQTNARPARIQNSSKKN
jgi:hypothetical protein